MARNVKQIEDVVNNCDICKGYQRANAKEPMLLKEIPKEPWEILATDIFYLGNRRYIMVVDTYSKYVELEMLEDMTAETSIKALKRIFSRYGIPKVLYSDSGTQYNNYKFIQFANEWSFRHVITSPKHHQSNGLAERHIQTLKRMLKKVMQEGKDKELALLQLRNIPIDDSGVTPAELLYGRQIRNLIPGKEKKRVGKSKITEKLKKRQIQQKLYYDKNAKLLKELKIGDNVKIHAEDKRLPHRNGKIHDVADNPRSYKVKTEQGEIIQRNRKALTKGKNFEEQIGDLENVVVEEQLITSKKDAVEQIKEPRQSHEQSPNCSSKEPIQLSRTGRVIKKPAYLKDYEC